MFTFPFFAEYPPKKIQYMIELEAKVIEFANMLAILNAKMATSGDGAMSIDVEDIERLKEKLDEVRRALEKLEREVMKEVGVEP